MPFKYIFFPDPLDSLCQGRHDDLGGMIITAVPAQHPFGRLGQAFFFPDDLASGHGFEFTISHPSTVDVITQKGILYLDNGQVPFTYQPGSTAGISNDDYRLKMIKPCPDPIPVPPPSGNTPLEIINSTYANGHFDLATKDGCGSFTEACCTNLHNLNSSNWGHIKKIPPQNNYNGHAVDAVMLLFQSGETLPGIYDIIISSESAQAKPAFNFAGPVDPSKWYYPA